MGGPVPSLPPPGWYPDPSGRPGSLHWDGAQWTTGVPAAPQPKTMASKLLWLALAGFLVMQTPRFIGREGGLLAVAGFSVFVGGLIGAAFAAFYARWKRRRAATTDPQTGGYPNAGP